MYGIGVEGWILEMISDLECSIPPGGDRSRHQLLSENTQEERSTTQAVRRGDGVLYSGERIKFSLLCKDFKTFFNHTVYRIFIRETSKLLFSGIRGVRAYAVWSWIFPKYFHQDKNPTGSRRGVGEYQQGQFGIRIATIRIVDYFISVMNCVNHREARQW